MPPAVAVKDIGVGPCRGETCGDMLKAMARVAPSQPNEAMARVAPRKNGTISLDPNRRVKIPEHQDSKFFSKTKRGLKSNLGSAVQEKGLTRHQPPRTTTRTHSSTFGVAAISAESPCSVATFVVNSEPHTGERLSISLCVRLMMQVAQARAHCLLKKGAI